MAVWGLAVLLIIAQVNAKAVPAANVVQRVSVPVEENALSAQPQEAPVGIQSLDELGQKYNVGNISTMIEDMESTVISLKTGDQRSFLTSKIGEARFAEFERKLDMAVPDYDALRRESGYIVSGRLPLMGHKMILGRFIKRFSTAQYRFSEALQDLSEAITEIPRGSTSFFDRLHIAILKVNYEFTAYLFKKAAEEAERDYRSLADN